MEPNDKYGELTGTSMAAAFVSGTAALIYSAAGSRLSAADVSFSLIKGMEWYGDVFNASYALWGHYGYPHKLEIISPKPDSYVSNIADIVVMVNNPKDVANVVIEIVNLDTDEYVIETISGSTESGRYVYSWDTTSMEGGLYEIYATSYDIDDYDLAGDMIYCYVLNEQREDGLVIEVKEPGNGNIPASGALVTVHHAFYSEWEDCIAYEEVWYGHADENGRVEIPGTIATSGND